MKCLYHSGRDFLKLLVPVKIVFAVGVVVISIYAGNGLIFGNTAETASRQDSKQNELPEPTPPEKVENTEQTDVGSLLNARIESLIKEKEPEWTLVKNQWGSWSESSYKVWSRSDNLDHMIAVRIHAKESTEEAKLTFEKGKSPMSAPVSFEGKNIEGYGDEGAFLRPQDPESKRVSLLFSLDRFYVHITGETSDVLRFAKHIQEVLKAHEKVENAEQTGVGALLNARIESLISEKESEWKLVKNLSSSRSESSYRVWNRLNSKVSVDIQAQGSIEEAKGLFEKSKSLLWVSSGSPGREIEEFGDEGAFLRSNDGRPIPSSLTFSIGKFYVLITGETSDVLRFAKHISEALRAHR